MEAATLEWHIALQALDLTGEWLNHSRPLVRPASRTNNTHQKVESSALARPIEISIRQRIAR